MINELIFIDENFCFNVVIQLTPFFLLSACLILTSVSPTAQIKGLALLKALSKSPKIKKLVLFYFSLINYIQTKKAPKSRFSGKLKNIIICISIKYKNIANELIFVDNFFCCNGEKKQLTGAIEPKKNSFISKKTFIAILSTKKVLNSSKSCYKNIIVSKNTLKSFITTLELPFYYLSKQKKAVLSQKKPQFLQHSTFGGQKINRGVCLFFNFKYFQKYSLINTLALITI